MASDQQTKLRTFKIVGHFQASDIDDALNRLSVHFAALRDGDDTDGDHLGRCELHVWPADRDSDRG